MTKLGWIKLVNINLSKQPDWEVNTSAISCMILSFCGDDLIIFQDLYSQSIQTLYDEQKKRIPLTEMIAKLEHKTKELEKVREIWTNV